MKTARIRTIKSGARLAPVNLGGEDIPFIIDIHHVFFRFYDERSGEARSVFCEDQRTGDVDVAVDEFARLRIEEHDHVAQSWITLDSLEIEIEIVFDVELVEESLTRSLLEKMNRSPEAIGRLNGTRVVESDEGSVVFFRKGRQQIDKIDPVHVRRGVCSSQNRLCSRVFPSRRPVVD